MKHDDRQTVACTGSSAALTGQAFARGSANDGRTDEAIAALHIMYSLTRDCRLRDELLATRGVADATSSDFEWQDAGANYVRGMTETVDLCRLLGPREPQTA